MTPLGRTLFTIAAIILIIAFMAFSCSLHAQEPVICKLCGSCGPHTVEGCASTSQAIVNTWINKKGEWHSDDQGDMICVLKCWECGQSFGLEVER